MPLAVRNEPERTHAPRRHCFEGHGFNACDTNKINYKVKI